MEEPKNDDVESPNINKIKLKRVIKQFGIVFITIGILYGVGSMFISEPLPEEVEIITGEELAEIIIPPIIEYTAQDDPEIEYVEEEREYDNTFIRKTTEGQTEKTTVVMIPMTVLDMSKFIVGNTSLTNQEIDLLLSYAVGKERGAVDPEVDNKVREIMKKYMEGYEEDD